MTDEPQPSDGDNGSRASASWAPKDAGKKRPRPKRTGWRRLIPTWRMTLGGVLLVLLLVCGGLVTGYMLVDIPKANQAALAQNNVFLDSNGDTIARDGAVNRESIQLSQVPKRAQHAVLAAEDRDFYSESAVDPAAMLRAGWNTVTGKGKQSGSTITQQYVKNYYLDQDQTLTRKAKEFFIAIKLDREASKDEILEGYLNTSYFGRNAYGIQAAAQAYYGKDIGEVNTAEGAYLATLLNAPSAYDVISHPENEKYAKERWDYVLDGMVKKGWMKQSERRSMSFPTPHKAKPAAGRSGQRGYLIEAVKSYLRDNDILDDDDLKAGGYRITTTIDKKKQEAFTRSVDNQLMSKLSDDRDVDAYVRAGGASIDPKTGEIVALYGGVDATKQFIDNSTRRDYQVGSTFKPFVLASAVDHHSRTQDGRSIGPETVYDGTNKRKVVGPKGQTDYGPENEDQRSYGQIPVSTATDKSVNAVYAQMAQDVGPAKVKDTAIALGLDKKTPELDAYPSIALGVANASVLDMTKAYATLANHGKHGHYSLVSKITKNGEEVKLPGHGGGEQVVSRAAADTTTSVLQHVVEGGTAVKAQAAGRPAAGKTGTAEEDKAAWFAGYTPDLATVVAIMGQDSESGEQKPLYGATGASRMNGGDYPTQIWAEYTKKALAGKKVQNFDLDVKPGSSAENTSPPPSETASDEPPQNDEPSGDASDQPPPPDESDEPPDESGRPDPPTDPSDPESPPTDDPPPGDSDGGDQPGDPPAGDNGGDGAGPG